MKHHNILFAGLTLIPAAGMCADLLLSGFDGLVSAAYSKPRFENALKSIGKDGIDYRASIAWQTTVGFGAQVDFTEMQQNIGIDRDVTLIPRSTALHAYFRNSTLLAGFLYQDKRQKIKVDGVSVDGLNMPRNISAVEAQWYGDKVTWYGQFGRQRFMFDFPPVQLQGDVGVIQFRFFPKENWLISTGYFYSTLSSSVVEGRRGNAFIAGVEYQVPKTPLSLFAQHIEAKYQVNGKSDVGAGLSQLGVKFSWGRSSLQQRDRTGASLDPIATDGLIIAPSAGGI